MVVGRKGQPAGKEEDSETSHENGSSPVPKSVCVVSGRQHHRLRMLVDDLMCRDGRSDGTITPLLESSSSVQSAHSIWSKTSKSTEPWLRIRTVCVENQENMSYEGTPVKAPPASRRKIMPPTPQQSSQSSIEAMQWQTEVEDQESCSYEKEFEGEHWWTALF